MSKMLAPDYDLNPASASNTSAVVVSVSSVPTEAATKDQQQYLHHLYGLTLSVSGDATTLILVAVLVRILLCTPTSPDAKITIVLLSLL